MHRRLSVKNILILIISFLVIYVSEIHTAELVLDNAASEKEYYEKLGLSLTEWQYIKRNRMPMKKVYELMQSGISITEYSKSPWKEMRMSERKWIRKRRSGLSDEEIKAGRASGGTLSRYCVLQSFFFPGYNQLKKQQYAKGLTMLGIAGASLILGGVTLSMELQSKETPVDYPIFFFVCLPIDMGWSGIDMYVQVERELNKEAARFTLDTKKYDRIKVFWNIPIRFGKI